jgi:chaperonin GroES
MAKRKPVSVLATCTPRNDYVVVHRDIVRRNEDGTVTSSGGIILPENTVPDHRETGIVLAVGPGRMRTNGKRVPVDLKLGDRVLIASYAAGVISGSMSESGSFDDPYVILREEEILAVLDPATKE